MVSLRILNFPASFLSFVIVGIHYNNTCGLPENFKFPSFLSFVIVGINYNNTCGFSENFTFPSLFTTQRLDDRVKAVTHVNEKDSITDF